MAEQSYASHAHRPRLSGVAGIFTLIALVVFAIVAVARKLLVALWRYVDQGLVLEGAVLKG